MTASPADFLTTAKNAVTALGNITSRLSAIYTAEYASESSGQLSATALVVAGQWRVKGVSVIAGSAAGYINDSATAAGISTGTRVYQISSTPGWYPLDLPVSDGIVFEVGTGLQVVIVYTAVA